MISPSFTEFKKKLKKGNLIPVWQEVLADFDTPVSAFKKIESGKYSFLLESVEGGERIKGVKLKSRRCFKSCLNTVL